MLWVFLALLSGGMGVVQDNLSKKVLVSERYSDWTVILARFIYVLPFFGAVWVYDGYRVSISNPSRFITTTIALVLLEVIAQWFYHQAIKFGSLSMVKPFLSLTPIVVMPTAYLLRGDIPSIESGFGVVLTCFGLWLLLSSGPSSPGQKETNPNKHRIGPVTCMVFTSLLWAVTTTLQKTGAQLAGVTFFGFCYTAGIVLVILTYHLAKGITVKQIFNLGDMKYLIPIGLFAGLGSFFQYQALTMTNPAYPNAVKRIPNTLHLWGDRRVFSDKVDTRRVVGNLLSLVGTLVIILGS